MTTVPVVDLELVKGEDNFFDVDLSVDLDAGDLVWFTAKYRKSDLDADAALLKTRSSGILDIDTAVGQCQVRIGPVESAALLGRGLIYDVKVFKADVSQITTVVTGTIRLIESTNKTASGT